MSMIHRFLAVGLVASLVGVAFAADDAPQSIKVAGLTIKAPAASRVAPGTTVTTGWLMTWRTAIASISLLLSLSP